MFIALRVGGPQQAVTMVAHQVRGSPSAKPWVCVGEAARPRVRLPDSDFADRL